MIGIDAPDVLPTNTCGSQRPFDFLKSLRYLVFDRFGSLTVVIPTTLPGGP